MFKDYRSLLSMVLLFLFSTGCASAQVAQVAQVDAPTRNPFRSAVLNAEFTSFYPRSTQVDPLDLASREAAPEDNQEEREDTDNSGNEDVAFDSVWEPMALEEETTVALATPVTVLDETYNPLMSAAYIEAVFLLNDTPVWRGEQAPGILDVFHYLQSINQIYHASRPAVGDVVFFHNTFDRNGDGRINDWYSHMGVVEGVDDDGTIAILSYMDERVTRSYMNLETPQLTSDEAGMTVNSEMRAAYPDDPAYTQYLSSDLFAGFGNLLGDRPEFVVIDNWEPGMNLTASR